PNQGGTPPGPNQPGTIFTPPGDDGAGNPTPASYTVSYNENSAAGAALGQVQAGDVDGDDVTFAISAGNDNGWYAIDPTT
ncbi:cadherin repeat domain-containing protein, partial [Stenotrophomonas sp. Iso1]|uniref:cadherin repeat domain-containing protein n=1 Tax=Stenotrophomonas sp. Iso1 TaxID=2977283 RepID=UPI0022B790E7